MEKTYVMIKPDAYERKLMGRIITKIEEKGFKITNMKMMWLTEEILKEHYHHHIDKPFFKEVISFMTSGPVVAMIVEGEKAIEGVRKLIGPTQWVDSLPGTIRGDWAINTTYNLIHGSDSVINAEIEIKRFFGNI